MKKRTVSQRDFFGAFCGGILGILAFGYLHPITLPFGCFLGVVIGWWYEEIWQSAVNSFHCVVDRRWAPRLVWSATPWRNLPLAKRERFAKKSALLAYIGLNLLWIIQQMFTLVSTDLATIAGSLQLIFRFILLVIVCFAAVFSTTILDNNEDKVALKKTKTWLLWKKCVARGPFRFLDNHLTTLLLDEINLLLFIFAGLIWYVGVGGAFILFVVAPISAIVGVIKAIYNVSTRTGHWFCFGITIVVTSLTAWVAHPYFDDVRLLWTFALVAGLVSAVVTTALQHAFAWFFSINKRLQAIALAPLAVQLAPKWGVFGQFSMTFRKKLFAVL